MEARTIIAAPFHKSLAIIILQSVQTVWEGGGVNRIEEIVPNVLAKRWAAKNIRHMVINDNGADANFSADRDSTRRGILACAAELNLVTPGEMAKILRCSSPQVLRLMRAGTIPVAFSVGRLHRFHPSAVLAALAAHKTAPEDLGLSDTSAREGGHHE